jgi:hypothetical protein
MNPPFPESFSELGCAIFALIGIIFALLSLSQTRRPYAIRMSGIFLLIAMTIVAKNGWTYFAAVFIIGTLVTELEFLQNLAAIIRGDKNYFDYLKETRGQIAPKTGGAYKLKTNAQTYRDPMEFKILQTLWTKQVNKWPDFSLMFTFRINRNSAEFLRFREAGNKLMGEGLISETDNGQFFLTQEGFEYCKKHYKEFPPDQWWPEEGINHDNLKKVVGSENAS